MKKSVFALLLCLCHLSVAPASASGSSLPDPAVVSQIDFARYSGLWNEVAHSPNYFQKECLRSTAEYKVLSADSVSVHNICYKANSKISDISGTAKVSDAAVPAKLRVRFNFFARGDYWVTYLDPDYRWAVVSGPQKKSIFILARDFPLAKDTLDSILAKMQADGYDVENLIYDRNP